MLVAPASRWRLTAKLRRVAMFAGPWPVRIWERSSPTRFDAEREEDNTFWCAAVIRRRRQVYRRAVRAPGAAGGLTVHGQQVRVRFGDGPDMGAQNSPTTRPTDGGAVGGCDR
jgi:hypothetical protein